MYLATCTRPDLAYVVGQLSRYVQKPTQQHIGGALLWASRRQSIVTQSTAEAEYVAACEACMEGQGLRTLLIEVFSYLAINYRLGIDNQAAFVMATNPTYSRRTRHIVLRWHYVRDQVVKRTVELWKVKTEINPSDLMTKPLASGRLEKLSGIIGMTKNHVPKGLSSEEGVLE
ncbi:unnamed protein product [Peronospora destructor]|uniref:Reverse transcriptase Ty1/copia-type domain-containing protein n=1 Tax=Peronospora destructor TaxID=86335 RepID=A0AAV0TK49_9STRA|nr:unnamed protein product [Peronospora destructor]